MDPARPAPVSPPRRTDRSAPLRTVRPPLASTSIDLLERSHAGLVQASVSSTSSQRYVEAHLAALRAAAALLGARSAPSSRGRLRSVWEMLPGVAAETTDWATYFAASARRRAAIERGSADVSTREADDLLRAAQTFIELVRSTLGLPIDTMLPAVSVPAGHRDGAAG